MHQIIIFGTIIIYYYISGMYVGDRKDFSFLLCLLI